LPCKKMYANRAKETFTGFIRMLRQVVRAHGYELKRKRESCRGRVYYYYCVQQPRWD
jgi:hypothetical protein